MADLMYSGVKAVIRNADGNILFFKQQYKMLAGVDWYIDLPGGRVNTSESPEDALKREVKEEVNLEIDVNAPVGAYYFIRSDGVQTTVIAFECVARDLSVLSFNKEENPRLLGMEWLSAREVLDEKLPLPHESFRKVLRALV